MKRITSIISSDSEDEDKNLSKIKGQYKIPKKVSDKETSNKEGIKRLKSNKNQMTIEAAFSKVTPPKRKGDITMDNFLKKIPKIQSKVASSEKLFNTNCESTSSVIKNSDKIPSTSDLGQNLSKTKSESIPNIKSIKTGKSETKSTPKIISPINSPNKSTSKVVTDISSPGPIKPKAAYHQFLHRPAPQALGSKEIPEGSPNCFRGMTFVITGVLDSIDRDDAQSLIEKYGGKVTKAVSGRTTYLVLGQEPGESKIKKANQLKTKQINEDELFELIRSTSSKISKTSDKLNSSNISSEIMKKKSLKHKDEHTSVVSKSSKEKSSQVMSGEPIICKSETITKGNSCPMLFVDKYQPTSLSQIIGQHGDRSPANKLLAWLRNFDKNLNSNSKSDEDGSSFRAVLLSGPPGIGKTTTARVVCKQLGYDIVERNASCVRSKTNIKNTLSVSLVTTPFNNKKGMKHCLIMDEVDGMAGNEDRGGINELIQMVKTTKHPIICICNDRQARKLQSFVKYVYDLRFRQLTVDHMKAAIIKITEAENISLPEDTLNCIIKSSNFDMRQVLNNLQMWSSGSLESETIKSDAKNACKEFQLGPFDVIGKVFSHDGVKTINEKSDLFFYDYQLSGLFVQENYPLVRPNLAKGDMAQTMKLMSIAADSISIGDIVNTKIRSTNNWTLLPTQAMFSSVIPGEYLYGRLSARIQFPSWLGKFSKSNKNYRILSTLCSHLSLSTKGGVSHSSTISMDYGDLLVKKLTTPLINGDIDSVLKNLDEAQLLKEDMDMLIEVMTWSHQTSILSSFSTQSKSALTRAYNRSNYKLPYPIVTVKKILKTANLNLELMDEDDGNAEEEENQENEEDDIDADTMIVKKVKPSKNVSKTTKDVKPSGKRSEEKKEKKTSTNYSKKRK